MEPDSTRNGAEPVRTEIPRRKLLESLVGLMNLVVMTAIVAPVMGFISAPLWRKKEPGIWVDVLGLDELQDGETKSATYQIRVKDGYMMSDRRYSVFLYRKGDRIVAYDPSCPHLGCHVEFKDRKKRYVCPCHGGVFDEDGSRLSGPPPRGLSRITTKVKDGRIWLYKEQQS